MDKKPVKIDDKTREAIKADKAVKINTNQIINKAGHGHSTIQK